MIAAFFVNEVVDEALMDYRLYEESYARLKELDELEEKQKLGEFALDINQIDVVLRGVVLV